MFGRHNLPPAPTRENDLQTNIGLAAAHAYATLVREKNLKSDVQRAKYCHYVTRVMFDHIVDVEPGARTETNDGWDTDAHSYLVIPRADGEIIADGQWQQFFKRGELPSDAPSVLVGTREEVKAALQAYGMPEYALGYWDSNDQTHVNAISPIHSNAASH